MNIQHINNSKRGKFFITNDEKTIAEMTYIWTSESKIIIEHTEVDESLKGQGVAKKLLLALVAMAKSKALKVNATCDYAKAALEKTDEFSDILG